MTHTPFRDPTAGFITKIDAPPYAVSSDSLLRRISAEGWKTRSQTQNDGLFQNKMKISRVFRGSSATRFGDISSAGGGNGEFRREIRLTRHTERTRHRSRHASESAVEIGFAPGMCHGRAMCQRTIAKENRESGSRFTNREKRIRLKKQRKSGSQPRFFASVIQLSSGVRQLDRRGHKLRRRALD